MRKRSIKVRITVWYTALMVLMAAMVLAFVVAISSSVTVQTDLTYLSQTVRGNLDVYKRQAIHTPSKTMDAARRLRKTL